VPSMLSSFSGRPIPHSLPGEVGVRPGRLDRIEQGERGYRAGRILRAVPSGATESITHDQGATAMRHLRDLAQFVAGVQSDPGVLAGIAISEGVTSGELMVRCNKDLDVIKRETEELVQLGIIKAVQGNFGTTFVLNLR
jgi:hypothetical protein